MTTKMRPFGETISLEEARAIITRSLRPIERIERVPLEGVIETTVPSPDYELMMWQA